MSLAIASEMGRYFFPSLATHFSLALLMLAIAPL
jgi:hypothetical protein